MKISWENRTRLVGGENESENDKLPMFVFWGFMRDENLGELIILWVARTRGRRNLKLVLFAWRGILDCQRLSYGWFIAGIEWSWIGGGVKEERRDPGGDKRTLGQVFRDPAFLHQTSFPPWHKSRERNYQCPLGALIISLPHVFPPHMWVLVFYIFLVIWSKQR